MINFLKIENYFFKESLKWYYKVIKDTQSPIQIYNLVNLTG
jgi:hypothetical protein